MMDHKNMRPVLNSWNSLPDFTHEEPWRIFRIMAEFVDSFETMANQGPLIPIFGSARIKPDHPYYQSAEKLAAMLVKCGYGILTGGSEQLDVSYRSAVYGDMELPEKPTPDLIALYQERLSAHVEEDLRLGYTTRGIQRDDLLLSIDGNPVQTFGSQGQRKSTAIVLKLAQAYLYNEKMQRSPVVLLDDVMGELDERRQRLIYEMVEEMQVFITLCNPSSLCLKQKGKTFRMQAGILTEEV